MRENDIRKLLSWSETNVCTDGGLNYPHPRGAGSFTRILGRYVREQKLMSLETAVESPQEPSEGIISVWVHGAQVYADGKTTAARPGQIIKRQ